MLIDDNDLKELDALLNDFTIDTCDYHLANHQNCEGCFCYIPGCDSETLCCVLDRTRVAVVSESIRRKLHGQPFNNAHPKE